MQALTVSGVDGSKQRAEAWKRKVAERTKRMQLKHDELQQVGSVACRCLTTLPVSALY